tara:strand:+ start:8725 stop:10242 length:1518 start_codon:yes stop_codon:yes gene_type:complete
MRKISNHQILEYIKNCKDISEVLLKTSERLPKKIFINFKNKKITFSEFNNLVNCCCNFFLKKKIKKKNIISVKTKNSLEFLVLYFACIRFKLIINPIPSSVSEYEFLNKIKFLKSKIAFVDKSCENKKKSFFCIDRDFNGDFCNFLTNEFSSNFRSDSNFNNKDTAVLYYSSGTTDNPKIIEYSYFAMLELQKSMARNHFTNQNTNHLCILPFGHTSVLRYSIKQAVLLGSTINICENFWNIKNDFWKLIKKHKINFVQLVPTLVLSILSLNYKKSKIKNLFFGCGSAFLSKTLQKKFEKKFNIKLFNYYGLSEIGASHFENQKQRIEGSIGKPIDVYKLKIINSKKKICKVNEIGELLVKSKCIFNGYYKNKDLTKKSFFKDYFKTGDMCFKDKLGYYHYVDRKKDLIIKGGVNILPSEIDEAIMQYDKNILECSTIGQKNDFYGEIIKSFIILKKNKNNFISKLRVNLIKKLGLLKCPDIIVQTKEFTKTPSGKIIKRLLHDK